MDILVLRGKHKRLSLSLHVSPWNIMGKSLQKRNFRLYKLSSEKCAHFPNYRQASFSCFRVHAIYNWEGMAETCTGGLRTSSIKNKASQSQQVRLLSLSGPASLGPMIIPEEEPLVCDGLAEHWTALFPLPQVIRFTPLEIWQPGYLADKFL